MRFRDLAKISSVLRLQSPGQIRSGTACNAAERAFLFGRAALQHLAESREPYYGRVGPQPGRWRGSQAMPIASA